MVMSLLYNFHCLCVKTFTADGAVTFGKGEIYLADRLDSGVYFIDLFEEDEDYYNECLYDIMDLEGEPIGYLASVDFDENFEVLEFVIHDVDKMFNKIMDGTISH